MSKGITTIQDLRIAVNHYYDLQQVRVQTQGRISALKRDGVDEEAINIREQEYIFDTLMPLENKEKKRIKSLIQSEPISAWLLDIGGIAEVITGGLIAWFETMKRFETVSKVWKYSGLHVEADGKAAKLKRGQKICWNPKLKTLCFKIGNSFVKTSGSQYRSLYDWHRARYENLPCNYDIHKKECPDIHKHRKAMRVTTKTFLAHLWIVWRWIDGVEIRLPYPQEYLKKENFVMPPNCHPDLRKKLLVMVKLVDSKPRFLD